MAFVKTQPFSFLTCFTNEFHSHSPLSLTDMLHQFSNGRGPHSFLAQVGICCVAFDEHHVGHRTRLRRLHDALYWRPDVVDQSTVLHEHPESTARHPLRRRNHQFQFWLELLARPSRWSISNIFKNHFDIFSKYFLFFLFPPIQD